MSSTDHYDIINNKSLRKRYRKTIEFLEVSLQPPRKILDLGTPNPLSKILTDKGFDVKNTQGEDLDERPSILSNYQADITTAFEIFEHLINPLGVLQSIPGERLFASIPLSLWFAKAYRSKSDEWDRHFHEFEDWQFDWLLDKGGWKVIRSAKWTSPINQVGIRPLLRLFTDRYYIVEAIRKNIHN